MSSELFFGVFAVVFGVVFVGGLVLIRTGRLERCSKCHLRFTMRRDEDFIHFYFWSGEIRHRCKDCGHVLLLYRAPYTGGAP